MQQVISGLDSCKNDHMVAFEAEFSEEFDSYLVSVQTADGRCQTQAIKIDSRPRNSKSNYGTELNQCIFFIVAVYTVLSVIYLIS